MEWKARHARHSHYDPILGCVPRLFKSHKAAQGALTRWLKGKWFDGGTGIGPVPYPSEEDARDPNDMEIIPFTLVEGEWLQRRDEDGSRILKREDVNQSKQESKPQERIVRNTRFGDGPTKYAILLTRNDGRQECYMRNREEHEGELEIAIFHCHEDARNKRDQIIDELDKDEFVKLEIVDASTVKV